MGIFFKLQIVGYVMASFLTQFMNTGIEGAAKGIGNLAKDVRAAITGEEPVGQQTKIALERIAVELEQIEQQLPTAVNRTMQVEATSEHWPQYSWRPFWGFASGAAFVFVISLCCYLGYRAVLGGKPEALAMVPQLVTAFSTLFAIPGAILGVTAWHRGKEKRERLNK